MPPDSETGPPQYSSRLVAVGDAEITVAQWGEGPAEIVLLHDGLGSIEQWRSIPANLASKTGRSVLAYDRPGHGQSTPVPTGPWPADWLHREAARFADLLEVVEVKNPLLVGHSDGGSIALLYAAALGSKASGASNGARDAVGVESAEQTIRGVITLAAHSWVEQTCFDAIAGMRNNSAPIVKGLARNNANPDALFEAWSGVWVCDEFRDWDIRALLANIDVPTVIVQGEGDEYAPDSHAIDTAAAVGSNAQCQLLENLGHLLHHQDPDLVVDVVARFDQAVGSERE
ncbi:MAG: alpha/beta fold hydrolase [Acidimicrobiales bacterium]